MISRVHSSILQGIDAVGCEVEADVAVGGMGETVFVGAIRSHELAALPQAERVARTALHAGPRRGDRKRPRLASEIRVDRSAKWGMIKTMVGGGDGSEVIWQIPA